MYTIGLASFTERYHKWCKRHGYNFQSYKSLEIFCVAKDLIAVFSKNTISKTLIKQAVIQFNEVSKTVEHLRNEIKRLVSQLTAYPVVMAVYRVGNPLVPQLMAEIGDISRFHRRENLTTCAALFPVSINSEYMKHRACAPPNEICQDFVKRCFKS